MKVKPYNQSESIFNTRFSWSIVPSSASGRRLFVIDEIGKMELFSDSFVKCVQSLFNPAGSKPHPPPPPPGFKQERGGDSVVVLATIGLHDALIHVHQWLRVWKCKFDNTFLRGEIQAWDLQSLLIKPVQRVLKYPLLLDKLVETTSSKHDDRVSVMNARETMGQVAQDINEVKRRKDIG